MAKRKSQEPAMFESVPEAPRQTKLERMLDAYRAGLDTVDGHRLGDDNIAGEIVGKYRPFLNDKNGVNHDGPLFSDIKAALDAAKMRGWNKAKGEKSNV